MPQTAIKTSTSTITTTTYGKSTADKIVTGYSVTIIRKYPRLLKEDEPQMTALCMKLSHFEELAKREGVQLYKREPNYIEYRRHEPEQDAYDRRILSAPIRENNTIVEFTDKMITNNMQGFKIKLKEFEAEFIDNHGYVRK